MQFSVVNVPVTAQAIRINIAGEAVMRTGLTNLVLPVGVKAIRTLFIAKGYLANST